MVPNSNLAFTLSRFRKHDHAHDTIITQNENNRNFPPSLWDSHFHQTANTSDFTIHRLMLPERTDSSLSQRATDTAAERVIVAVRAEKVISKNALAWALTHVVHPGDGITLLAVFPAERTGNSVVLPR